MWWWQWCLSVVVGCSNWQSRKVPGCQPCKWKCHGGMHRTLNHCQHCYHQWQHWLFPIFFVSLQIHFSLLLCSWTSLALFLHSPPLVPSTSLLFVPSWNSLCTWPSFSSVWTSVVWQWAQSHVLRGLLMYSRQQNGSDVWEFWVVHWIYILIKWLNFWKYSDI